jgi:hypothetical protein
VHLALRTFSSPLLAWILTNEIANIAWEPIKFCDRVRNIRAKARRQDECQLPNGLIVKTLRPDLFLAQRADEIGGDEGI